MRAKANDANDEELLAAYVDGVAELTPDERRRVEAAAPAGEIAATRTLLDELRALSPEGNEPDWAAMERAIGAAVGDRAPRAWWRVHWRWLVPALACATAAAIVLVVMTQEDTAPRTSPGVARTAPAPVADPHEGHAFVYLNNQAIDVEDVPEKQILDGLAPSHDADEEDDGDPSLINTTGLAWVDQVDGAKLDRLENALTAPPEIAKPKKGS
jgi:hypothetical protein